MAAVNYLRGRPYIDPNSIAVRGTSGGGDLALEVAAATTVAAIVAEEPASMIMAGVFTAGDTPVADVDYVLRYRAAKDDHTIVEKITRISSPILIIQGDSPSPLSRFNAEVLIPALNAAGKSLEVLTYAREPHSFAFYNTPQRTPRPAVALKAFEDMRAFLRQHVDTRPMPMDAFLVQHDPVDSR